MDLISQKVICEQRIIKYAVYSRILVLLLQLLSNLLITDHNANVFMYPELNSTSTTFDNIIEVIFNGFVRWDSQYFMHIAIYGYTYESTVAFFPLYPLLIRYISLVLLYIIPILNFQSLLLLVSFSFNLFLFVKTALLLFKLTLIFKNIEHAYTSSIIFCFNPASIFFSAPYSECLFCYLTFKSIYHCMKMSINWLESNNKYVHFFKSLKCIIYIALSAATRSNGILNIFFYIYLYIRISIDKVSFNKLTSFLHYIFLLIVILSFQILLMLIPFVIIQVYDYHIFCSSFEHNLPEVLVNFGEKHQMILPGTFFKNNQSWCYKNLPLAYSYVQEHYWNVGFFKYYQLKQLPNFCLAIPVIYIVLKNCFIYLIKDKYILIHMGILRKVFSYYKIMIDNKFKICKSNSKLFLSDVEFSCIFHALLLTIFCTLCIHIQVTTRMIFSATPVIYWFCSQMFHSENKKEVLFIKYYCVLYFMLGTIMFCNFLPWT